MLHTIVTLNLLASSESQRQVSFSLVLIFQWVFSLHLLPTWTSHFVSPPTTTTRTFLCSFSLNLAQPFKIARDSSHPSPQEVRAIFVSSEAVTVLTHWTQQKQQALVSEQEFACCLHFTSQ